MIIRIKLVVQVLNCYIYIMYTAYRKLRFTDEPWPQMNRLKIKINKIYIRYHYINDWNFILFKNKTKYTDHLSRSVFSRSKIINKIINIIICIVSIYKTHCKYVLILIINWISNQNQGRNISIWFKLFTYIIVLQDLRTWTVTWKVYDKTLIYFNYITW